MSSDRSNYHHMLIPINFLQWDYISVRSRVLLAMGLHSDNASRVSTLRAGELAILLGFVNEDGVETEEGIKAVRQARQALTKAGALRYIYHRKGGNNFHSWELMCSPLRPGLKEVWTNRNIVDLWADAEPSEPKVAKSKEVVEEEEEVVEPTYEEYDMYKGSDGLDYLLNIDGIWYETGSLTTKNWIAKPRHVKLVTKIED